MIYMRDERRIARKIKINKKYTLPRPWIKYYDIVDVSKRYSDLRMKCIEKYSHHAIFETQEGCRISFRYFELANIIDKGMLICDKRGWNSKYESSLIF